jgi:hypothetical protein
MKGILQMFHAPNEFRIRTGPFGSTDDYGPNGAFKLKRCGRTYYMVASTGLGWEHVSVSSETRIPNWEFMCFVKDLFWDPEDCVIQYHPPKSLYVNNHKNCLHLWRKIDFDFPIPSTHLVGFK